MGKISGSFLGSPIFYDLETSGLDHEKNEIIQIAAYAPKTKEWYVANVEFDMAKASKEALEINHYDPSTPRIPIGRMLREFEAFCKRNTSITMKANKGSFTWETAVLHGYNNINFDKKWIEKAYKDKGLFMPFSFQQIDWYNYAMIKLPRLNSHKQTAVADYLGIPSEGAHDAKVDVTMLCAIARELIKL